MSCNPVCQRRQQNGETALAADMGYYFDFNVDVETGRPSGCPSLDILEVSTLIGPNEKYCVLLGQYSSLLVGQSGWSSVLIGCHSVGSEGWCCRHGYPDGWHQSMGQGEDRSQEDSEKS